MDEDEFKELLNEKFLEESECSGNFALLVCISNSTNDEKNKELTDDNLSQKSQQCHACYWYNTAMNVMTDGPSLEDSEELTKLIDELDDDI